MTWFKVDDSFPTHPKVLAIPRRDRAAAVGLWTLAGTWCADQLTDGRLGEHMVDELAGTKKHADLLVAVGLWERTEGGYVFHDWADWQPTRSAVVERRDAEAKRKQDWRDRKRAQRTGDAPVPPGQDQDETRDTHGTDANVRSTRPDPTRPDPTDTPNGVSEGRGRAPDDDDGTRLPDDFAVTDDMRRWATAAGYADRWVDQVTERFADYWRAQPGDRGRKRDWPAVWRNWLRREADGARPLAAVNGAGRTVPSWEL